MTNKEVGRIGHGAANPFAQAPLPAAEEAQAEAGLQPYLKLFDFAPLGHLLVDANGTIRQVNIAAAALLGRERGQLRGARLQAFLDDSSHLAFTGLMADVFAGQPPQATEVRLLAGEHGPRVIVLSGFLAPGAAEALFGMIDVTPQHRMAEEVRATAARYRRIVETTSEGVVITDRSGTFEFVNERFAHMLGYPREAMVGRSAFDFIEREDHEKGAQRLEQRRNGVTESYETKLRHKDGHHVWIRVNSNPLLDVHGVYEGTLALISDITEKRQAEETRFRLAAIVESSADAIVSTNLDGVVMTWNHGAEQLYGYSAEEMVGQAFDRLLPQHDVLSQSDDRTAIIQGAHLQAYETTRRRKDGSLVDVSLTLSPIRDADGRVIGISKVAHDITARRQTEATLRDTQQQLLQSQKMEAIGNLAGGIAHDFNNLLSVILGYAGLLLDDAQPASLAHTQLTQIVQAAQKAGNLTKQLLTFSRKQVLQTQSVDLNQCIAGLEGMLTRLLGAHLQVSVILAAGLGFCRADPSQLEQVIINLAVNARDAMPMGGALTLQTGNVTLDAAHAARHTDVVPGPHVMLAVKDTGTGIEPSLVPRIFEPFFTTKEVGKGTGLGLSTVYGIIKQNGGHIEVQTAIGAGTTFRVYFPRAQAADNHEGEPLPLPSKCRGTEAVLLVDDEDSVRAATAAILRRQGYQVFEAVSAGDALVVFEQHGAAIALLVTDIIMPHMNGRELAQRLVLMRSGLKVLYVSGHPKGVDVDDAVHDASRSAYLLKPFLPAELGRAVRALLDASQGTSDAQAS